MGEGYNAEFKVGLPTNLKGVIEEVCDFANAAGGLVSAIPRSEFGKRNLTRNPLIFELFEKIRMVEHIGSGIARMCNLMYDDGLTPPEFNMDGMFTVTLRRPFDFDKWVDKWVDKRVNY